MGARVLKFNCIQGKMDFFTLPMKGELPGFEGLCRVKMLEAMYFRKLLGGIHYRGIRVESVFINFI